ncbi:substrate-binding periplasmic protein [Desulfovibrio inopinatus]|uniref:substrate-binding periplasmic protein n=1 Tax=Desulfovibrio inopinatus TaxID=102109 RepID=UPI00146FB75C|nr:ABC transporter substrate-binding protein [Desulfovibrio inopinatus]
MPGKMSPLQHGVRMLCASVLLTLILVFSTSLGSAETVSTNSDAIQRITSRGRLIVSQFRGSEPLFFFEDTGTTDRSVPVVMDHGKRIIGVDISLARTIADFLGVDLDVQRTAQSFNAVCEDVAAGRADLGISALSITPERALMVRFSVPYATFPMGVIINRKHAAEMFSLRLRYWDHPQLFLNNTEVVFAQQQGTAQEALAGQLFPQATILPTRGTNSGPMAVAEGKALATLISQYDSEYLLKADPELGVELKWIAFPDETDNLAVAVSPANAHLLAFVNVVISRNKALTDIDTALEHYYPEFSDAEVTTPQSDSAYALPHAPPGSLLSIAVTGVAFVILLVLWRWLSRPYTAFDPKEKP